MGKQKRDTAPLALPCGGCVGCRTAKAQEWSLRCHLERNQHQKTAFATLTYDDEHEPLTLDPRDLQLWLKRLRKRIGAARPLRYFACGEYGEQNHRPHYHAIIFGADEHDTKVVDETWGQGRTQTVNATAASINYVAGYTAKK